jgi:nitrogenase subunit NifH
MSEQLDIPVLPAIRTDQSVQRASRKKSFLSDIEPKSKALEDYMILAEHLLQNIKEPNVSGQSPAQV